MINQPISPAPFLGVRCLDSKQAKQFLHSVADVINGSIDDNCQVSNFQAMDKTDCLFEYANGARVRILVEFPEQERRL